MKEQKQPKQNNPGEQNPSKWHQEWQQQKGGQKQNPAAHPEKTRK